MAEKAVTDERDGAGRFRPGHAGGPGRPAGRGIGASLRRQLDPDAYAAKLIAIAFGTGAEAGDRWKPSERLRALEMIGDRVEGKPVNMVDMKATVAASAPTLPPDWDRLTPAEKGRELARIRAAAVGGAALPAALPVIDVVGDEVEA